MALTQAVEYKWPRPHAQGPMMSDFQPDESELTVSKQDGRGWARKNMPWLILIAGLVAMTGCVVFERLKPIEDARKKAAADSSYQAVNPPYTPPPPPPVIVVPESVVANPQDAQPPAAAPARP